jgi:hypothetical protein
VRRPREGLNFFELGTDTWLAMSSVLVVIVGGLALGNMIDVYRERADAVFDVDWACHGGLIRTLGPGGRYGWRRCGLGHNCGELVLLLDCGLCLMGWRR